MPALSTYASTKETDDQGGVFRKAVSTSLKVVPEGKISKIKNYETYLKCEYSGDIKPFTQIVFKIHQSSDAMKIGEILLQYYPRGGYYQTDGGIPILRLRHIEIEEPYRRQHHATRALETLFRELRNSKHLPIQTEVWLEYSTFHRYLTTLYSSFGFEETNEPSFGETKVLKVKLSSTKFPYFNKNKPEKNKLEPSAGQE